MGFFWGAWNVNGIKVKVTSAGALVGGFSVAVSGGAMGIGVVLTGFTTGLAAKTAGLAKAKTALAADAAWAAARAA